MPDPPPHRDAAATSQNHFLKNYITFQPGDYLRLGSLIVLVAAFVYALHAALVKRYSAEMNLADLFLFRVASLSPPSWSLMPRMNLADFFLFRVACATGFLFLFAIGQGELAWPGWQAWLVLLLAGTVGITISRALYYLTLRRLNLSSHSIILTLSPVVAVGWTLLLFDIGPTSQQLIGGVAVIAGVLMLTMSKAGLMRSKGIQRV